jgi:thioredoxin 1
MHTTELTTANFESTLKNDGIVFIDWWAEWCGPCKAFGPVYDRLAAKHADITWGKIDTEAQPELAGAFGIRAIPTLMVFRDGILVFEQPGMMNAMTLDKLVDAVRALDMNEVKQRVEEAKKDRAHGHAH